MRAVWFLRVFDILHVTASNVSERKSDPIFALNLSDEDVNAFAVLQSVQFLLANICNSFPLEGITIDVAVSIRRYILCVTVMSAYGNVL